MARVSDAFLNRLRTAAEARPDEPDSPGPKDYIPWWSPEEGDRLAGELIRIDTEVTEWGPKSVLVVDDAKLGMVRYTAPSVLQRQIEQEKPKPGEVVGVVYLGKKNSKRNTGHQYHDLKLIVDRPSGQMTLRGPAEDDASPDPFEDE